MKKKIVILTPTVFICLFSLIVTLGLLSSYLGYKDLLSAKKKLGSADVTSAVSSAQAAYNKFGLAKTTLSLLRPNFVLIGKEKEVGELEVFLTSGQDIAQGTILVGKAAMSLQDTIFSVWSGKGYDVSEVRSAQMHLTHAKTYFSHATS
mgnify:CR=1 FL=1